MKRDRVKRMLTDIRQRNYLDAYSGWLLALTVVVIDIVASFVTDANKIQTLINSTIILLLGIIALATAEIRHGQFADQEKPGNLWRFFGSRYDLPTLAETAKTVQEELWIFGLQLGQVVHEAFPSLENLATAGSLVKIAVLSPVDHDGKPIPWIADIGVVHSCPNLPEVLRANLRSFLYWHQTLPPDQASRVEIRAYTDIPTATVILADPGLRSGYIHVEPILYRMEPVRRPSFRIRRTDDNQLFDVLFLRYTELWNRAVLLRDLTI